MPSPPPPESEHREEAAETGPALERFEDLAKRLLKVPREAYEDAERKWREEQARDKAGGAGSPR